MEVQLADVDLDARVFCTPSDSRECLPESRWLFGRLPVEVLFVCLCVRLGGVHYAIAMVRAMCAIDALGMSAMLGHPVTIIAARPDAGRVITVNVDSRRARWRPRSAVVFVGSAGDTCRPSADRSCGYINFFASRRAARAWAGRHPEVTGRLLTQEGGLNIGIAQFGNLLQAGPPAAVLDQVTADPKDK